MAISLTESAADRVSSYLQKRGDRRRSAAGCHQDRLLGLFLCHQLCRRGRGEDIVFEDRGVKIVVDPEALALIDGTEVDFVKNGLNEAFSFRNPNVTGECGCGESFNI